MLARSATSELSLHAAAADPDPVPCSSPLTRKAHTVKKKKPIDASRALMLNYKRNSNIFVWEDKKLRLKAVNDNYIF